MRLLKNLAPLTILFLLKANISYSQGCSDAGFCTMNSFKPNAEKSVSLKNQVKVGMFGGTADYSITTYGTYLEYNRSLNQKLGLDFKLNTLGQSGNMISRFGLADFFVNANFQANEKLKFTLGAKIPLSDANNLENGVSLPMDYQSSLGTFDFIFGIGYELKKIQLVAALQLPITQNENQFRSSSFPINSILNSFQSTNQYKRSGDVLLRISYPFYLKSKLKITPSILPIYHLSNDLFTDNLNNQVQIIGSKGLTLNGNIYLDYELNKKNYLQFNFGMPFIVRENRPDGLTRHFIASLEYRIKF